MATYLGTHGSRIQNYTTDPDNPNTGEVWYNDTSNALKFQTPNTTTSGSFRTGGNLNTARQSGAGFGIYTAALFFGGTNGSNQALTEAYNGTSWTEVNNLNAAKQGNTGLGATGTAGLSVAAPGSADVELWNGTNWTEVSNINY